MKYQYTVEYSSCDAGARALASRVFAGKGLSKPLSGFLLFRNSQLQQDLFKAVRIKAGYYKGCLK